MQSISELTNRAVDSIGQSPTPICQFHPSPKWRAFYLGLDESHPEVAAMCLAVERWAQGCLAMAKVGRMLVLIGANGVGKSTAGRGAIRGVQRHAIDAWHSGNWRKPNPARAESFIWSDLAGMKPEDRNDRTSWPEATQKDAVLLDDVGSESDSYKSGVSTENLRIVLELRAGLWTIVTTNIGPEHWEDVWDARVASRLYENAIHVELRTAPDWRRLPTAKPAATRSVETRTETK